MTKTISFGILAALLGMVTTASAQAREPLLCAEGGASPAFMSAASYIQYACGYLLQSDPPRFVLAETNLRMALGKEPANADALLLLVVSLAGAGSTAEALEALNSAARVDPQAQARLAAFVANNPKLRSRLKAAPGAQQPDPPPPAADPAAETPQTFAVGARVEVQHVQGVWVPGIVTSANPGVCPYYNVRYNPDGRGAPMELGFFCKSIRTPSGVTQPQPKCGGSNRNCPPSAPPPVGSYTCNLTQWDVSARRIRYVYQGYFVLQPGGRYRWLDNGGSGSYRYDAMTRRITWLSGPLQSRGGRAEYGLDGATPEITMTMDNAYSQRTGNAAPVWQCGRSAR